MMIPILTNKKKLNQAYLSVISKIHDALSYFTAHPTSFRDDLHLNPSSSNPRGV